MTNFKTSWVLCLVFTICSGCGKHSIFVEPGVAGKLGQPIKNADVFVPDANGNLVETTADLPAGTIVAVPVPKPKDPTKP